MTKAKNPPTEQVVEMVRRMPVEKKTCPQCGKEFLGLAVKKYCSVSCRNKAVYWGNVEERRARRRQAYAETVGGRESETEGTRRGRPTGRGKETNV